MNNSSFHLRLSSKFHTELRLIAEKKKISLNEFVRQKILGGLMLDRIGELLESLEKKNKIR